MQAVGQLMLDIEGTALSLADEALLRQPEVGGVILFGRNVESPEPVSYTHLTLPTIYSV